MLWVPEAWLSDRNHKTGRMAFYGASNWLMASRGDDYFSPSNDFNPYVHTWSLGLEEQFYLLFPFAIAGWLKGGEWRTVSFLICSGMLVTSLAFGLLPTSDDFRVAFHLVPARAWEFLTGVVTWQILQKGRPAQSKKALLVLGTSGLIGVLYSLGSASPQQFPVPGAIPAVLGTGCLLFSLAHHERTRLSSLLSWLPLASAGRMSYSLYLWHWPVFVLFRWTVGLDGPMQRVAALVVASGVAYASWRYIESHGLRATREWRPSFVVGSGIATMVVGAVLLDAIHHQTGRWSRSTVMRHAEDWFPKTKPGSYLTCGRVDRANAEVGSGWVKTISRKGCPSVSKAPRVFAIGDSHALALGPMYAAYVATTGAPVFLYNNGGCPVLSLQLERESSEHCKRSFQAARKHMMAALQPGDVVFLPSLRLERRVDQWGGSVAPRHAIPSGLAEARNILGELRTVGAHVVVLAPNLLLNVPLFRCADGWTQWQAVCRPGHLVERAEFEARRRPVMLALADLAKEPDVRLFDPLPILCPEDEVVCSGYRGGRPLFFDADHLSAYGSELLFPAFMDLVVSRPWKDVGGD